MAPKLQQPCQLVHKGRNSALSWRSLCLQRGLPSMSFPVLAEHLWSAFPGPNPGIGRVGNQNSRVVNHKRIPCRRSCRYAAFAFQQDPRSLGSKCRQPYLRKPREVRLNVESAFQHSQPWPLAEWCRVFSSQLSEWSHWERYFLVVPPLALVSRNVPAAQAWHARRLLVTLRLCLANLYMTSQWSQLRQKLSTVQKESTRPDSPRSRYKSTTVLTFSEAWCHQIK